MCCRITKKVISGVYQGVTTVELDNLASETAAYLTTKHPDYAILAARIAISNLHKETKKSFSQVIQDLYNYVNPKNGKPAGMISKETYECVMDNAELLDSSIIYERDFHYNLCVVFSVMALTLRRGTDVLLWIASGSRRSSDPTS